MSAQKGERLQGWKEQSLATCYSEDAVWRPGLRGFAHYRDLGVEEATGGQIRAHVVKINGDAFNEHHTTGLHRHHCDFQFNYCLKGWIKFIYEGHEGEYVFKAGDTWLQPAGIVHNEIECSNDVEILEIYSPAIHETEAVDQMADAAD